MADSHASGEVQIDETLHHHVCSSAAFLKVFIALLVLTVITVAVAQFDFGPANMFIAMAIAAVKASLVMAIFMHLRWDTPINNIAFLGSLIFLALLFLFTMADFATRGSSDPTTNIPATVDPVEPSSFHKWREDPTGEQ